jgi:hypothetical protein
MAFAGSGARVLKGDTDCIGRTFRRAKAALLAKLFLYAGFPVPEHDRLRRTDLYALPAPGAGIFIDKGYHSCIPER